MRNCSKSQRHLGPKECTKVVNNYHKNMFILLLRTTYGKCYDKYYTLLFNVPAEPH